MCFSPSTFGSCVQKYALYQKKFNPFSCMHDFPDRVEEFSVLLKRRPALVKQAFDLVDAYESSSDGMSIG